MVFATKKKQFVQLIWKKDFLIWSNRLRYSVLDIEQPKCACEAHQYTQNVHMHYMYVCRCSHVIHCICSTMWMLYKCLIWTTNVNCGQFEQNHFISKLKKKTKQNNIESNESTHFYFFKYFQEIMEILHKKNGTAEELEIQKKEKKKTKIFLIILLLSRFHIYKNNCWGQLYLKPRTFACNSTLYIVNCIFYI